MNIELSQEIFNITLSAISALVTLVIIPILRALGARLVAYIESKEKVQRYAGAVSMLSGMVEDSILEVEQTFVKRLKKEGKWTSEACEEARDKAMQLVKMQLGNEGIVALVDELGAQSSEILEGRISMMIEAFLGRKK